MAAPATRERLPDGFDRREFFALRYPFLGNASAPLGLHVAPAVLQLRKSRGGGYGPTTGTWAVIGASPPNATHPKDGDVIIRVGSTSLEPPAFRTTAGHEGRGAGVGAEDDAAHFDPVSVLATVVKAERQCCRDVVLIFRRAAFYAKAGTADITALQPRNDNAAPPPLPPKSSILYGEQSKASKADDQSSCDTAAPEVAVPPDSDGKAQQSQAQEQLQKEDRRHDEHTSSAEGETHASDGAQEYAGDTAVGECFEDGVTSMEEAEAEAGVDKEEQQLVAEVEGLRTAAAVAAQEEPPTAAPNAAARREASAAAVEHAAVRRDEAAAAAAEAEEAAEAALAAMLLGGGSSRRGSGGGGGIIPSSSLSSPLKGASSPSPSPSSLLGSPTMISPNSAALAKSSTLLIGAEEALAKSEEELSAARLAVVAEEEESHESLLEDGGGEEEATALAQALGRQKEGVRLLRGRCEAAGRALQAAEAAEGEVCRALSGEQPGEGLEEPAPAQQAPTSHDGPDAPVQASSEEQRMEEQVRELLRRVADAEERAATADQRRTEAEAEVARGAEAAHVALEASAEELETAKAATRDANDTAAEKLAQAAEAVEAAKVAEAARTEAARAVAAVRAAAARRQRAQALRRGRLERGARALRLGLLGKHADIGRLVGRVGALEKQLLEARTAAAAVAAAASTLAPSVQANIGGSAELQPEAAQEVAPEGERWARREVERRAEEAERRATEAEGQLAEARAEGRRATEAAMRVALELSRLKEQQQQQQQPVETSPFLSALLSLSLLGTSGFSVSLPSSSWSTDASSLRRFGARRLWRPTLRKGVRQFLVVVVTVVVATTMSGVVFHFFASAKRSHTSRPMLPRGAMIFPGTRTPHRGEDRSSAAGPVAFDTDVFDFVDASSVEVGHPFTIFTAGVGSTSAVSPAPLSFSPRGDSDATATFSADVGAAAVPSAAPVVSQSSGAMVVWEQAPAASVLERERAPAMPRWFIGKRMAPAAPLSPMEEPLPSASREEASEKKVHSAAPPSAALVIPEAKDCFASGPMSSSGGSALRRELRLALIMGLSTTPGSPEQGNW